MVRTTIATRRRDRQYTDRSSTEKSSTERKSSDRSNTDTVDHLQIYNLDPKLPFWGAVPDLNTSTNIHPTPGKHVLYCTYSDDADYMAPTTGTRDQYIY